MVSPANRAVWPPTKPALPTQAIENANEAAEIMEQQQTGAAAAIEQQAEQLQQDTQKLP